MNTALTRTRLSLAIMLASGLAAGNAVAQLEEVVVTAQKREQSLQDTPIAITAFDEQAIDVMGISNVKDLSLLAPNVLVAQSPGGGTGATIAIRGASTINPAITWEPVVGLYLDGVFLGKNLGGIFEIAELERVEVLRGPQGTLYGKNTVGGAINMVTRLPGDEFGGRASVAFGNEGYTEGRLRIDTGALGTVGEGLGEFRANLAYMKAERDGFYDNVDLPDPTGGANFFINPRSGDEFSNLDSEVWRLDAILQVTDSFSARYNYDSSERVQEPTMGQLTNVNQEQFEGIGVGFVGQFLAGYEIPEAKRADRISNDQSLYERSEVEGHAFFLDWGLGDLGFMGDVTLKYIGSYREMDWSDVIDIDGSPMDLFHSGRDIDYEQTSHEFQWLGVTDTVNYVVGIYNFQEKADVFNPITFFGLFGQPTDDNEYGLDNDSFALFGQAEWRPAAAPRLSVTLGLRYTEEEKDQYIVHPNASGNGFTFEARADDKWDNTSGTFVLGWDLSDDVNVYGRVAQGWKSGGFNGEAPTEDAFRDSYDPEEVLAYELGLKSRFMDDRIQFNAAAFFNDIKDMQFSVFLEGAGAAASTVSNAGQAETSGIELETLAQVTDSLVVGFNYGFLDAKYKEFIEGGVDVKDQKDFAYAPENTATLFADWQIFNGDWGVLDLHVDWNYNDEYVPYTDPFQNSTSTIDSYDIWNASLVLSDVKLGNSASMRFSLWGRNIADEEYRQNTIPFGFWTISYWGEPATYGFDARIDF